MGERNNSNATRRSRNGRASRGHTGERHTANRKPRRNEADDDAGNAGAEGNGERTPPAPRDGKVPEPLSLYELQDQSVPELHHMADEMGLVDLGALRKHELVFEILKAHAANAGAMNSKGVLEILPDGFGFLRSAHSNYLPCVL